MSFRPHSIAVYFFVIIQLCLIGRIDANPDSSDVHVWEMVEITLEAEQGYENYYTDVRIWVELKGPNFSKRVFGFWDGGNTYKVRLVATKPGKWAWTSKSNQPGDDGLNGRSGTFYAHQRTVEEKHRTPIAMGLSGQRRMDMPCSMPMVHHFS